MDTPPNTNPSGQGSAPSSTPTPSAPSKNILMAILSYIGPLVIVSYLTSKNDPFVKFHIKQGLVLVCISVIVWILGMALYSFWMVYQIVNLGVLVLAIIGIINAAQGQEKPLPVVGQFSSYFKF